MKISIFDYLAGFVFAVWLHGATGWEHDFPLMLAIPMGIWLSFVMRGLLLWPYRWTKRLLGLAPVPIVGEIIEPARRLGREDPGETAGLLPHGRRRIRGPRGIIAGENLRQRRDIIPLAGQEVTDPLLGAIERELAEILASPV